MKNFLRKETIGDELYIFNIYGNMIYKRWLKTGVSRIFHEGEGCTELSVKIVQHSLNSLVHAA